MVMFSNKYSNGQVDPSEDGKKFPIGTHVKFKVQGSSQSGIVIKQLVNSAIVDIDITKANTTLILNTKGQTVVNYHNLFVLYV